MTKALLHVSAACWFLHCCLQHVLPRMAATQIANSGNCKCNGRIQQLFPMAGLPFGDDIPPRVGLIKLTRHYSNHGARVNPANNNNNYNKNKNDAACYFWPIREPRSLLTTWWKTNQRQVHASSPAGHTHAHV